MLKFLSLLCHHLKLLILMKLGVSQCTSLKTHGQALWFSCTPFLFRLEDPKAYQIKNGHSVKNGFKIEFKLARAFQQDGEANMPSASFLKFTPILLKGEAKTRKPPSPVLCTLQSLLISLQYLNSV